MIIGPCMRLLEFQLARFRKRLPRCGRSPVHADGGDHHGEHGDGEQRPHPLVSARPAYAGVLAALLLADHHIDARANETDNRHDESGERRDGRDRQAESQQDDGARDVGEWRGFVGVVGLDLRLRKFSGLPFLQLCALLFVDASFGLGFAIVRCHGSPYGCCLFLYCATLSVKLTVVNVRR